jgi:hypothetical protein
MTDGKGGTPFRGESGERIKHKLQTGEDLDAIAKRLTMKICRAIRGRVGGPIYPSSGIALMTPGNPGGLTQEDRACANCAGPFLRIAASDCTTI